MTVVNINHLYHFLMNEQEAIIHKWGIEAKKNNSANELAIIIANTRELFDILSLAILHKNDNVAAKISRLAKNIAEAQVDAKQSISESVLRLSKYKAIFLRYFVDIPFDVTELKEAVARVNYVFDQLLYQSVSHYTDVKDSIIAEKTDYIDSTHKDRLTLLGQMTSSFIHEFRNPLTSVQGFVQLLQDEYPEMKYLPIILSEIEQLNFQVSQFLLLSKKEIIGKEKSIFSLNYMIEEILIFLYPSILDGNVTVTKKIEDNLRLFGYADECRQVFINIIFNAIDVLNHSDRGDGDRKINITAHVHNHEIIISIVNNGPMIPENMQKTIFEPFVTTKQLGTGLGLFICKEIIEKHKGTLKCTSHPDETAFIITLPVAQQIK